MNFPWFPLLCFVVLNLKLILTTVTLIEDGNAVGVALGIPAFVSIWVIFGFALGFYTMDFCEQQRIRKL